MQLNLCLKFPSRNPSSWVMQLSQIFTISVTTSRKVTRKVPVSKIIFDPSCFNINRIFCNSVGLRAKEGNSKSQKRKSWQKSRKQKRWRRKQKRWKSYIDLLWFMMYPFNYKRLSLCSDVCLSRVMCCNQALVLIPVPLDPIPVPNPKGQLKLELTIKSHYYHSDTISSWSDTIDSVSGVT